MVVNALVALGGNAILKSEERGTAEEQLKNVRRASLYLVKMIQAGHRIAVTHGNGPQVGDILLKNERSSDELPSMPLDICGAQSQGMIGYMLQQSICNELSKAGIDVPVVSLVTQVLVDKDDVAFSKPSKPIGPFYTLSESQGLRKRKGWSMTEDSGRGYRRVVPSPMPQGIVERDAIRILWESGSVVIAAGGGGVPVVVGQDGRLEGVVAVVDKDLTAQIFASVIDAEALLMLTDVERIFLNYGKPSQVGLDRMTTTDAEQYLREGHFASGSMAPKVIAALRFLEGGGEKAIVTSLEMAHKALAGKAGTTICG
jgi:carbamate kinase